MVRSTIWFAALLLGAGLLAPGMLHAQARSARTVQDEAGLFSKDAITRANGDIAQIKSKHNKDLFIETVKEGPKTGAAAWARSRAKNANVNGVYVVITTEPKHFEIAVGNKTREKLFTQTNIDQLAGILKSHMGKDRDAALQKSAAYVLDAMNTNIRARTALKDGEPQDDGFFSDAPANPAAHRSTMSPWVSYALLIGGVLLVGWLLMAVFRGIGNMAGGGGGGGGFMTGMLGGLFGAMAGMWIYNSFFGGSHAHAADPSSGADTDYGSTGGDYGNDAGAGGDDFGDKGGGGGGDWGGGDAGGGDWGGGGGDFGGGGDW